MQRYADGSREESYDDTQGELLNLRHFLRLLASPAKEQLKHYKSPVNSVAEEMVNDYDTFSKMVQSRLYLTERQKEALFKIDTYITELSENGVHEIWNEATLPLDYRWETIRLLAKDALSAFGWSFDIPPEEQISAMP